MSTKIQITITPDDDYLPPGEVADTAMARTIDRLAVIGIVPLRKISLTIECKDEDTEAFGDQIDAALSGRPAGIEVVVKTTTERHVARLSRSTVSPMDKAGWN